MNTLISFELAKLLKEKGYPFDFITIGDVEEVPLNIPTIAEVVMWLYEKHGIWVCVSVDSLFNKGKHIMLIYKNNGFGLELHSIKNDLFGPYNSPTEAYEAAILYTLNNLI